MNEKIEAGHQVARQLFPTENAIDAALTENAAFVTALIQARQAAQQPCGSIQKALDEAIASGAALAEARRAIVGAHHQILRLRNVLGLSAEDFGCASPCVTGSEEQQRPVLRDVAA